MTVVAEFNDEGISGAKGRDKRTGFDNIIKGALKKDFDTILLWSVDRLGRSLQDLVSFLNEAILSVVICISTRVESTPLLLLER
jgi:DNA invertase Pin-like site-specific DNA recombinase